ncbi:hypothetical protein OEZ85_013308 [Tetradesmus obliquus]|uniref:Ketoreductase domain-containing protein n=1 Tax=Tetradesmus obliquus TaxID=3088 RepID=A0ABY8U5K5_TETOB|nr:hypothetical protein OEZ85_013308 [Tetradesmus obliquus]
MQAEGDASQRRLDVLTRHITPGGTAGSSTRAVSQHEQSVAPTLQRQPTAGNNAGVFAGQVVVITGAAKGIGEAAALGFAKEGAQLLLTDLDAAAVEQAAARCRQAGSPKVAVVAGDITAADAAAKIAGKIQAEFGRLDVLVNNAGYTWDGVIHKMGDKQWQAMLDVHVTAPFKLIQAVAPLMREAAKREQERQGQAAPRSIINISSTSGTHGNAGQANYAAGKAAIVGLTKTIAKEWGHVNVRCNAIAYGMIDTRLTRAKEGGEAISIAGEKVQLGIPGGDVLRELAVGTIPLARIGTAEEAAGAILMLASPWAGYITGQVLEVNGGSYM